MICYIDLMSASSRFEDGSGEGMAGLKASTADSKAKRIRHSSRDTPTFVTIKPDFPVK